MAASQRQIAARANQGGSVSEKTHYESLGVPEDATSAQIKEAYRREAMKWHPDRHESESAKDDAHRRFKEIGEAYRTLRDPEARAAYDAELALQRAAPHQRSQDPHASARSAPPESDRSHDSARSTEDADQAMFLEQMVDLAFELMTKGFPEHQVTAALVGLGCPDSMARAVAAIAAKNRAPGSTAPKARTGWMPTSLEDLDEAPWGQASPIYRLALEGTAATQRFTEAEYESLRQAWQQRVWRILAGLGFTIAALIALVLLPAAKSSWAETLTILAGLGLLGTLAYWLISGVTQWSNARSRAWMIEHRVRYYLSRFERFHQQHDPSEWAMSWNWYALLCSTGWMAYRRMFKKALLVSAALVLLDLAVAIGAESTLHLGGISTIAFWCAAVALAAAANHQLFLTSRQQIGRAIHQIKPSAQPTTIRKAGGTSWLGVIAVLLASVLLAIPGVLYVDHRQQEEQRVQREAQMAAEAEARAAADARDAAVRARYDQTVQELERLYPWLNPDSPQYNAKASAWLVDRRDFYVSQGQANDAALRRAVDELLSEVNALQQRARNEQRAPQPSSNGRPLQGADGQSAAQVLCNTFGACN